MLHLAPAGNPISRKLFAMAYASKKAAWDRGDVTGGRMAGFWDRLVFSKIKARLGGGWPAWADLIDANNCQAAQNIKSGRHMRAEHSVCPSPC